MSQTIQSVPRALVESVARRLPSGCADDFRLLMNDIMLDNLTALSPGGNLLKIGGAASGGASAPVGVTHSVAGANTQLAVSVQNPDGITAPIWHEFSYSPVRSFTKSVTTLDPTTATSFAVALPGQTVYTRLRSSFDKKNWSNYQLSSQSPTDAGLFSSAATSPGGAFNQTNFAVVNSQQSGGTVQITVDGTGGSFTPYTAVKGGVQSLRPSARIVGVELNTSQFLGYDGSQFRLSPTLSGVFPDDLEPVGVVTTGSGVPGGGGFTGGNGGRMTAV